MNLNRDGATTGDAYHEKATPVLNYMSISKLIKVPVTTVIELVKAGVLASRYASPVVAPSRFKFKQHHIGYLVSSTTLQESAHLSFVERAQMFHRKFGEVKISPSSIRCIYLRHKIRFKNIKRGKREIDFTELHYQSLFYRMSAILKQMQGSKTKVVYLDETVFTFNTFSSNCWANNRKRVRINDSDL
ncbi:MAG: hypothetical protein ACKO7B_09800 [Flavobacteriales bacterium]